MNVVGFEMREVTCSSNAAEICYLILKKESLVDRDKEHFWSIGLNGRNKIRYVELVTLGLLDQTIIAPRELFRLAIREGVLSVIVCHNHPSGSLEASPQDRKRTKELAEAGKIIGIKLLDHVIIAKSGHYSFSDEGLI